MNPIRCPLCHSPFEVLLPHARCNSGHCFDRAKEGYLNLLPVQKKNSKEPGDSREQLRARQLFLESGHYQLLLDELIKLLPSDDVKLIDIGCGEGYFTRGISRALSNSSHILGVDIAKEGVRLAAQMNRREGLQAEYIVASNFDLPYQDSQADVVVRIFAPSRDAELSRVLKVGGRLIMVVPAAKHLLGLRQTIYADVLDHQIPSVPDGFKLLEHSEVSGEIYLDESVQIMALLQMTPFSWRLTTAQKELLAAKPFNDSIAFDFYVYEKI